METMLWKTTLLVMACGSWFPKRTEGAWTNVNVRERNTLDARTDERLLSALGDEESSSLCLSWSEIGTKGSTSSVGDSAVSFLLPDAGSFLSSSQPRTLVVIGDKNGEIQIGKDETSPSVRLLRLSDMTWSSQSGEGENIEGDALEGYASAFSRFGNDDTGGFLFVYGGHTDHGEGNLTYSNELHVLDVGPEGDEDTFSFRWITSPLNGAHRAPSRSGATLSTLTDGRVVLFGGTIENEQQDDGSVWILAPRDEKKWQWIRGLLDASAFERRAGHTANVWRGRGGTSNDPETIVIFGGCDDLSFTSGCRSDVRLLTFPADASASEDAVFTSLVASGSGDTESPTPRGGHSSAMLNDRTLLIFGGCVDGECYDDVFELHLETLLSASSDGDANVASARWRRIDFGEGMKAVPRLSFATALTWSGPEDEGGPKVLVLGGQDASSESADDDDSDVAVFDTNAICPSNDACLNDGVFMNGVCSCGSAYDGKRCEHKKDEGEPCPNDCNADNDRGSCVDGECRCKSGFGGDDCSFACPGHCSGRGTCTKGGVCECEDPYFGTTCESKRCPKDCSGAGTCDESTGICACKSGFDGSGCERELTKDCPNGCNAPHGTCVQASESAIKAGGSGVSCECKEGFTGKDCGFDARCPDDGPSDERFACSGHGVCASKTCECEPGFEGKNCASKKCPKDCSNHGTCDTETGECMCEDGFRGEDCATAFKCDDDCSGHGDCVGINKCDCSDGFTGNSCEFRRCASEDDSLPCSGHGTCDAVSGMCKCDEGFGDAACGTECPKQCSGHGECVTNAADLASCACAPGWNGEDCSISEACPGDGLCSNHGQCELGRCRCHTGWAGEMCEERYGCPGDCNAPKRGVCKFGKCFCAPGYAGKDCADVSSCPNDCSNRGTCDLGRCFCDKGWKGDDCSSLDADNSPCGARGCNGRGVCVGGQCACNPGFGGRTCDDIVSPIAKLIPSCDPKDCSGHGVCDLGQCACDPEWRGVKCDKKYASACPEGCSGHGACFLDVCVCVPGWKGDDCGVRMTCGGSVSRKDTTALLELRAHVHEALSRGDDDMKITAHANENHETLPSGMHLAAKTIAAVLSDPLSAMTKVTTSLKTSDGVVATSTALAGSTPGVATAMSSSAVKTSAFSTMLSSGDLDDDAAHRPVFSDDFCNGHGVCALGECFCHPSFHGEECEKRYECPMECSQRGVCVKGKCMCVSGFGGEDCSQLTKGSMVCPKDCSGHGICELGKCFCFDGFTGLGCETHQDKECPNDCFGNGHCDRATGTCFCDPGYEGEDCGEVKECSETCDKRGVCKYGKCFCVPGWTGKDCDEKVVNKREAATKTKRASRACPNMCSGHGICHDEACRCEAGYGGDACDRPVIGSDSCPNDCNGRGQCFLGRCYCDPEYEGRDCARHKQMPCPAGDCGEHGTCHLGKCFCDPGWDGEACDRKEKIACPRKCHGNGVCDSSGTCVCAPGWFGATCDQAGREPCVSGCDERHGHCLFGNCFCESGFGGPDCKTNLLQDANSLAEADRFRSKSVVLLNGDSACVGNCSSGQGMCVDGKCFCYPGFEGTNCEALVSCPVECGRHGSCVSGRCVCELGWSGESCADRDVADERQSGGGACDESDSSSCSGNGVCANGRCWCDPSFVGAHCSESSCPKDCNGQGICYLGECYCANGFTGPTCVSIAEAKALRDEEHARMHVEDASRVEGTRRRDADANDARRGGREKRTIGVVVLACVFAGLVALAAGMVVWSRIATRARVGGSEGESWSPWRRSSTGRSETTTSTSRTSVEEEMKETTLSAVISGSATIA